MRAVITVIGKDTVGILAKVSTICSDYNANIIDVTQTVMNTDFTAFTQEMKELGTSQSLSIHVMHEDIFNSMHKI